MLTYKYTARDTSTDKIIKSTIQAQSEREATKLLMSQSIVPIKLTPVDDRVNPLAALTGRVTAKDRVIFTRQLSTLITAGLPLSQSLQTVQDQTDKKALKTIIGEINASVSGGANMADSFAKYPKVFNQVFVAMIRAGELSGTLDKSLERLADQMEHDANIISKIRGAMTYPIIVLVAIIGVMAFLMIMLMPQIKDLYESLDETLPLLTQILVAVTDFSVRFWWLMALILIALIVGFFQWRRTDPGRRTLDQFKLNVPMFKGLFRKLYMARFARTAQTLLASGVQMLEMMRISADAVNNVVVKEEILQAAELVKNGKPLSEALTGKDYILPFVPQMIKIGEQAGGIDGMLEKVAVYYENEVDAAIAALSTAIEPVLMLALAGMAAIIVVGVLWPIYSLSNSIGAGGL